MQSDSAFFIGSSHNINQDYAVSGIKDGIQYCIVSDGCSSSQNTDWGSRILTRACIKHIDKIHSQTLFSNLLINTAEHYRNQIELNSNALDATLLVAGIVNDVVYIRAFGDGVVYIKKQDDSEIISQISYDGNAPYYLSYLLDRNRQQEYKKLFGEPKAKVITESEVYFSDPWFNTSFPINEIKSCTLFSDGIESFKKTIKTETTISTQNISDIKDLIYSFTSYKIINGEFVKRRSQKVLKELKNNDIVNTDDLSISSLILKV